jgi:tetratricopeptide (TPR) repeat protein
MRTINTGERNSKFEYRSSKQIINSNVQMSKTSKFRIWDFGHWDLFRISDFGFRISLIVFLSAYIFSGCIQKDELELARDSAARSEVYYQHATGRYRTLIAKGAHLDTLHLELGRLYYEHGDFIKAIEELKKTNLIQAKKLLAISYYRLGNFTDALEIFNKHEISDDEYLYFHGLTCEKLNLFDQALEIYSKVSRDKFKPKAKERIESIEKQETLTSIKDIDSKVAKILANAPSIEQYPQAGALILSCEERVEVNAQGTQVSYLHYLIKILNERGKEQFSETHIDYDSTFEKVELEYARTIRPDGAVVDVGARHIRDVSRYLNFPLYSNVRAYIISFPEIMEGAAIEYKVKVYNNRLINNKDFVLAYTVQANEPIIAANFSVTLPQDRALHIKIINDKYNDFAANLSPDIENKGGYKQYHWQFKDIPQIIPESNMPPSVEINPTLLISTFDSWQDIYNWWWDLAKDKIKADTSIKKAVSQLIKNQTSDEAKIRSIYNFCAQKIRYVAVEYGKAGYEPHYAADIFKNKYGDCKDQAILLISMLKEAGITAWPVLIATKEYYNLKEDFASMLFNHCIAALPLKDKIVFLDPTAETCPFGDLPTGDQGRKVLIFKEDSFKIEDTPMYPPGHNLLKQLLSIKINSDETISAEKSIFTQGLYDQAQRYLLLYTQPELIQEMLKERIQDVSIGAKLNNYNIENLEDLNKPVVLSYAFGGPEYFTAAGPLRIMPQLASLDTSLVAKDRRKFPIDFGILDAKEIIFNIEIPKNFTLKYMPDSIIEDSPWLNFIVEYSRQDNKIIFRQKSGLKKNIVLESEYADFKKFFERLAKKIKQRIVLEKIK